MARICLITPSHLASNPRITKEADALSEAGYDVVVIAADSTTWAREHDRVFAARSWSAIPPIRFGPDAPFPRRLLHAARQHAAKVLFAVGLRGEQVQAAAWHPIALELVQAAVRTPADLYVAHYPAALPAAAIAARRNSAKYAYDAEDFHLGDRPEGPAYDAERLLLRAVEGGYIPGAAYVTAAAPGIAAAYAEAYGLELPTVILNVFPLVNAVKESNDRGAARPGPSIYWFSQVIGHDRGLQDLIIGAAKSKSRPHIYLRGSLSASFEGELRGLAASTDMIDRIHLLAPASPDEMERLASLYDLGYAGEIGDTPNRKLAWSNKQFTYLLAGIPMVMSDTPGNRMFKEEASEAVSLFPIGDVAKLAEEIDDLLLAPEHLARRRAAAFHLGKTRFNWDVEKHRLLNKVAATLARQAQ